MKECTRCGWCCNHVMVKIPKRYYLKKSDWEWLNARRIRIFKDQMIIPSPCSYLDSELINFEKYDDPLMVGSGSWVSKCLIHDTKPVVCKKKPCVKNFYPGIDKI